MQDHATKHYLRPDSHAAKLERALKSLGRKYAAHTKSTFAHNPEPRVLTAFVRKQELRLIVGKK